MWVTRPAQFLANSAASESGVTLSREHHGIIHERALTQFRGSVGVESGGDDWIRTCDLHDAIVPLCQLSYVPRMCKGWPRPLLDEAVTPCT
jgi:hypothetical protein